MFALALLALTVFSFATVGEGDAVVSARTMTVMARGGAVAGAVVALLAVAAIVSALASENDYRQQAYWDQYGGSLQFWLGAAMALDIAAAIGLLALAYRKSRSRAVGLLIGCAGIASLFASAVLMLTVAVGN